MISTGRCAALTLLVVLLSFSAAAILWPPNHQMVPVTVGISV